MGTVPARTSVLVRTVALVGGGLFVLSLGAGVYAYLVTFDRVAAGGTVLWPTAVDVGLFTAFALHHSVFARARVKAVVETLVPPYMERSLYVWVASLAFAAVCFWWQPVPGVLWNVPAPAAYLLAGLQILGLVITILASRMLGVISLAGVRQAFDGRDDRSAALISSGWYRLVRHPIYLGWVLMVWPTPHMTASRLVFAAISTLYLVLAVPVEERLLQHTFGSAYDAYAGRVRWRIVPFLY